MQKSNHAIACSPELNKPNLPGHHHHDHSVGGAVVI
jgi:hypothetical protein